MAMASSGSEIRCFVLAPSANIRIFWKEKIGPNFGFGQGPQKQFFFFFKGQGQGFFFLSHLQVAPSRFFFTVKLHRTSHPHTHVADDMERFNNN